MHPAKSVIFFTTISGAGYGLLTVFVLIHIAGLAPADPATTMLTLGFAFVLIVSGLLSSTLHLGHPERAWRALSQWRSSWLSREGALAVAGFVPMGAYGLMRLFGDPAAAATLATGAVAAACALATVYCTAMIYASLRPVQAWATGWTPACYVVLGLMSGAVLCNALLAILGHNLPVVTGVTSIATLTGFVVKVSYWQRFDANPAISTPESATGLGGMGRVRLLEPPHTEANYLMKEMVFRIARRHAARLRTITVFLAFVVPIAALAGAFSLDGPVAAACKIAAAASMIAGLFVERWLFFAEAKHSVALYYGH